jgi:hypothetical protein
MFELLILFQPRDCIITNKCSIFIFLNRKLMNTYIILCIICIKYKYLKKGHGGDLSPPRLTTTDDQVFKYKYFNTYIHTNLYYKFIKRKQFFF